MGGKDINGNRLVKNGFVWMNSLDSEVQDFLLDLFLEVATTYPGIAGVQGDDRLPALPSTGGYDEKTKALYRSQFDKSLPANPKDRRWLQWRANLLSDFLARLYREIKTIDPTLIVSMSPSIFTFGFNEYLQDVPAWIDRGIVDFIHPQLYRRKLSEYRELVDDLISRVGRENLDILSPGILTRIGDFQIDPATLWECISHNRSSGINGEVLFFFESLRFNDNALATFLKEQNYANYSGFRSYGSCHIRSQFAVKISDITRTQKLPKVD
jgi:uncharacterized lipoprotein YddW (UPF0748 family)